MAVLLDEIDRLIWESEGTDVFTLFNMIFAKDLRTQGYDWIKQSPVRKSIPQIFDDARAKAGKEGVFQVDEAADHPPQRVSTVPTSPSQQSSEKQPVNVEVNNQDPNIKSSDPKYNPCPAFFNGVCRIDGRPCLYSLYDYTECGKYSLATTGDPNLMEIPAGREQTFEYQTGIRG